MQAIVTIPAETLAFIIATARKTASEMQFEDEYARAEARVSGFQPLGVAAVSTDEELISLIEDLKEDALSELFALMWVGSGDFDKVNWGEALARARIVNNKTDLMRPVGPSELADLIEAGLTMFRGASSLQ